MKTRINLNTLARDISTADNRTGKNLDIVEVKVVLRELGDILAGVDTNTLFRILDALTATSKRKK